jgi:hypothetical protein
MKKFMIKNKTVLIVAIAMATILLTSAGILAGCSVDVPEAKKIDLTFDVVKIDSRGKETDTLQLHITGQYLDYQHQEDTIKLDIEDFDSFTNIRMRKENNFAHFEEQQRGCVYFETERSDRTYTETLRLYFTDNFDRVVLQGRGENTYIGSGSCVYTTEDCVSYFEDNEEEWDFVESHHIDMTIDVGRLDDRGYEIEKVPFDITGYYRDYLFKTDVLYLDMEPVKKNLSWIQGAESASIFWVEKEEYNCTMMYTLVCGYSSSSNSIDVFDFVTTDEFDRFIITWEDEGVFYAGSVSGKYTSREIVEFFNQFVDTGITLPEA